MGVPAIRVEGLGKQYRVGLQIQNNTLRDVIGQAMRSGGRALRALTGRDEVTGAGPEWFWALRDLDFEVPQGQSIAFVGANGAGKSTLLKVLSRITEPTVGRATIRGRVGSLIEIGAGFHSELTGRENTFLNGAILGMKRAEIARKFDEIIAFADVERFIDTPIKRYSSGMQLRLGFAVAVHLETEVLIVDEVLAVGDAEFQRKCLTAMRRLAGEGRTVLFVSHNAAAVKALCDRAIWLNKGRMAADGDPQDVLVSYLTAAAGSVPERVLRADAEAPPAGSALQRIAVRPTDGTPHDRITIDSPFLVEIDYWTGEGTTLVRPSFALFNEQETLLFENVQPRGGRETRGDPGLRRSTCRLPSGLFTRGVYRIEVNLVNDDGVPVADPAEVQFAIMEGDWDESAPSRQRAGVIRPALEWESETIAPERYSISSLE